MKDTDNLNLQDARTLMLNNMLWVLVVVGAITLLVALVEQFQVREYALALAYIVVYALVVLVTARKHLPYSLRALTYLAVVYGLVLSEFIYFGVTAFSYVLMFSLIVCAGLFFGLRLGLAAVLLSLTSISLHFWYSRYVETIGTDYPLLSFDGFMDWLSPLVAFVAFTTITLTAITMMVRLLGASLDDKNELVRNLREEIANHLRSREALALSEGQYSTLFERSSDAVFLIDTASGRHLDSNQSAELLTGFSASELRGLTVYDVSPGSAEAILQKGACEEDAVELGEVEYRKNDGSERVALVQCMPVNDELAFVIARDITERKKLEEQFYHSQKMDAVGQLAGGVAHDFNNSLQAILGYGETALEKLQGDGDPQEDLRQMLVAGAGARTLVGQLLAFSRRQVLEMKDIDLNHAIEDSMKFVQRLIGGHVELKFEPSTEQGMIRADRTQIEQILMNLCINARDAMGNAGVLKVCIENRILDESFCATNPWAVPGRFVVLSVADGGSGMSEEIQSKIFEPFFTTKESGKGTGLGLSTVFGIVQQHQGLIDVRSSLGTGTTIDIYLPQTKCTVETAERLVNGDLPSGTETILLADDNDMVRELTETMLKMSGYSVLTAASGDEAIRVYDENSNRIDLALLDVVMPNKSGKEVFEHISAKRPELPVLFASGYTRDAIHTDFVLDKDIHLIQKPFSRAILLQKLRELLDTPQRLNSA